MDGSRRLVAVSTEPVGPQRIHRHQDDTFAQDKPLPPGELRAGAAETEVKTRGL